MKSVKVMIAVPLGIVLLSSVVSFLSPAVSNLVAGIGGIAKKLTGEYALVEPVEAGSRNIG